MADGKTIAAAIREHATGVVEWRVQHPIEKSYCISFNHHDSINPERDAREWLAGHKTRHPGSQFATYEVAEVRWFSQLERAALEAADLLDPPGVPAATAPEVTDAMVDAYLRANDAYWKRTDELPTPPDKWRTGTPREATREGLRAALGVEGKTK